MELRQLCAVVSVRIKRPVSWLHEFIAFQPRCIVATPRPTISDAVKALWSDKMESASPHRVWPRVLSLLGAMGEDANYPGNGAKSLRSYHNRPIPLDLRRSMKESMPIPTIQKWKQPLQWDCGLNCTIKPCPMNWSIRYCENAAK